MRRAYKFLLRPTVGQQAALTACLDDHRQLYNAALQERRDAYRKRKVSIRYGDQSAQLKDIRRDDPDGQGRWSFSSQQATLRRLDKAFQAFFRRLKAGQTPGFPRFKGAGWFDTVDWPKDRDGCRWNSTPDSGQTRVYLQGIGHIRVHAHRTVEGIVKTISVKREGRRWYLVLSCDDVPALDLPETGRATGIDMGIASFLTTADGEQIINPRHGRRTAERLAAAQRHAASFGRKKAADRSRRHRQAVARVAALHAKVRRRRLDHAHKTARRLVATYDVIACEALRITNMTRSASGTAEQPGTNVAQKTGLNRSILDAGWGVFLTVLRAKAESAGRVIVEVDPANTSRTCPQPECGHVAKENRPTQADFRCVSCGYADHADVVGATNILRAGLALLTS
ncbi:transposase [Actinoplanes sp. NPDC049802]|uniref:RNA-guided endonuclease InsQ/TnpB family protein n=1 Tax=Actinoplanes sp. NPDC049802 TaxID=3154742 RepID=UPI0033E27B45